MRTKHAVPKCAIDAAGDLAVTQMIQLIRTRAPIGDALARDGFFGRLGVVIGEARGLEVPVEANDNAAVAKWLDDRLVDVANAYPLLH